MTGRDLIIYILQNGLEDTPVYENGRLLGFLNINEAAVKFNVGVATIKLWYELSILDGLKIGDEIYIPVDAKKNIRAYKIYKIESKEDE